jgi:hypothetical protein
VRVASNTERETEIMHACHGIHVYISLNACIHVLECIHVFKCIHTCMRQVEDLTERVAHMSAELVERGQASVAAKAGDATHDKVVSLHAYAFVCVYMYL